MLVVKRYNFTAFVRASTGRQCSQSGFHNVQTAWYTAGGEPSSFHNLLCGDAFNEEKFPPFRDKESAELIRQCNHAEFVEDEWYAMVTEYGKTCLEACCGSVRYALTVIHNSRRNIYTEIGSMGENVWEYLAGLEQDILIAIHSKSCYEIPFGIPYVLRDYYEDGSRKDVLVSCKKENLFVPERYAGLPWLEPFFFDNYSWYYDIDCWKSVLERHFGYEEDFVALRPPALVYNSFQEYVEKTKELLPPCCENVREEFRDIRVKSYMTYLKNVNAWETCIITIDTLKDGSCILRKANSYFGMPTYGNYLDEVVGKCPKPMEVQSSIILVLDFGMYSYEDICHVLWGARLDYQEDGRVLSLYDAAYAAHLFLKKLTKVIQHKKLHVYEGLKELPKEEQYWCGIFEQEES